MPSRRLTLVVAAVGLAAGIALGSAHLLGLSGVRVRVATTTSLYTTGLLDYLAKGFEEENPGARIEFIAVGTGAALSYAERGDACAVLVHAPNLEREYLEKGVLEPGMILAYNYFVVVGPVDDPAGVSGSGSVVDAFERIYSAGESGRAVFVSRGDRSGTHVRELSVWEKAGLDPVGRSWYREAAAGMEQTLVVANELSAYSLSDLGTYLRFRREGRLPRLEILYAGADDPDMINIYSAYLVRSCSGEERRYAELFLEYLRAHQDLIGSFGVAEYGQPLFYPAEGRLRELEEIWSWLASGRASLQGGGRP